MALTGQALLLHRRRQQRLWLSLTFPSLFYFLTLTSDGPNRSSVAFLSAAASIPVLHSLISLYFLEKIRRNTVLLYTLYAFSCVFTTYFTNMAKPSPVSGIRLYWGYVTWGACVNVAFDTPLVLSCAFAILSLTFTIPILNSGE